MLPHTLFISDLHLGADQPHSTAAFLRFVDELAPQACPEHNGHGNNAALDNETRHARFPLSNFPPQAGERANESLREFHVNRRAESLYILGDLFDYWAGDDDLDDPFHAQVIASLRNLAQHGTDIYLLHGNRDLLMGEALADACQATLLSDPTLIDLYGTPTLLSHGDILCTHDTEYQRYRAQVHDADFQQQFLAKPLAERKAYIAQLRLRSVAEKQSKDSAIMDVNDNAVAALLREHDYPRLIHGHTHRPGHHEHIVDGHTCERWVLGDWNNKANALHCDSSGIRWETIPN